LLQYFGYATSQQEEKMDKQMIEKIRKRLDGFPENKISALIDYIEFLKRKDNAPTEKKEKHHPKIYFMEAGP